MDNKIKKAIAQKVSRSFPEMDGVKPTVSQQGGKNGSSQFLFVFKGKARLPGGKTMNRIVRVLADASGNIIRMSTSR